MADVFTALSENRPYRKALSKERVVEILQGMAENKHLDLFVVSLLKENFEEINSARVIAQEDALKDYGKLDLNRANEQCSIISS